MFDASEGVISGEVYQVSVLLNFSVIFIHRMEIAGRITNVSSSEFDSNGTTEDEELVQTLRPSLFVSGLFMAFLSFITALSNGLLFVTLCKDPLKRLQARSSSFVMSLSMANFLVGILVEPTYSFVLTYEGYRGTIPPNAEIFLSLGRTCGALANNASFFTVCALALDHYLAVSRPVEYRATEQQGTNQHITVVILVIWAYSGIFSLLPFIGVPEDIFFRLDLHVNSSLALILLLVSYVALMYSYHKHKPEANGPSRNKSLFGVIFLLLVVAILTSLPIIAFWHIHDYCVVCRSKAGFQLTSRVVECLFYSKFAVDPFLYAWRLPRYRQALRQLCHCAV